MKTKKEYLVIAKNNFGLIASFCTILGLMLTMFVTTWEHNALAQTVDKDRCEAARIKMGQYEIAVTMSGKPASDNMLILMAKAQQIIDESCPKK